VLTLCLAIMTSSAAVPVQAHASGGACDFEGPGDGDPGGWGLTQGPKALMCGIASFFDLGHDALFGAAELLWEGVYGAGCGVKNLATWNGRSCETSVADSGVKARNFLNDWSDCIAAFDPTPFGILGTFITAEDVSNSNEAMRDSVQAVEGSAAREAVQSFAKSPAVQDAITKNPQVRKALGRAVPGLNVALIGTAIASECFSWTVAELSAIERADEDLAKTCHGGTRRGVTPEQAATCEEGRLMRRYVTQDNIRACLRGEEINVGWNVTTITRGGTKKTWDGVDFDPSEYQDICSKIILPEARDRGLIDTDDISLANTLAPAAPPAVQELVPAAVPGGSTDGSYGVILRAIAAGTASSFSSTQRADCTGSTDPTCQVYRAKTAVGSPQGFSNRSEALAMEQRCM
jgi:hypothetical protein